MDLYYVMPDSFADDEQDEPDINIIVDVFGPNDGPIIIFVNFTELPHSLDMPKIIDLTKDLVDSADYLMRKVIIEDLDRTKWREVIFNASQGLAVTGYNARYKLFGDSISDNLIQKRLAHTRHSYPVFHIKSDAIKLPWEFLYQKEPGEASKSDIETSLKSFWSLQSIISRRPRDWHGKVSNEPLPYIVTEMEQVRIGIVIEDNLGYAVSEIEKLQNFIQENNLNISIEVLKDSTEDDLQFVSDCNRFLSKDFHILHFACHASPSDSGGESEGDYTNGAGLVQSIGPQSYFQVCNRRKYLLKHFTLEPRLQIKASLVFLNACCTGIRNSGQTFQFVSELQEHGAKNIIAVETAMMSSVAEAIAISFYKRFLLNTPLGEALHMAKDEVVNSGLFRTDILALCYSLHADERLTLYSTGDQL